MNSPGTPASRQGPRAAPEETDQELLAGWPAIYGRAGSIVELALLAMPRRGVIGDVLVRSVAVGDVTNGGTFPGVMSARLWIARRIAILGATRGAPTVL
ncbi:MAG: hypothetical protein M3Q42_10980 [Pseudomonadota bacterium]|nr:hypothetical protein [Pseudomonadota bacterium]